MEANPPPITNKSLQSSHLSHIWTGPNYPTLEHYYAKIQRSGEGPDSWERWMEREEDNQQQNEWTWLQWQ